MSKQNLIEKTFSIFGLPIVIHKTKVVEIEKVKIVYSPDTDLKIGDKIYIGWSDSPETGHVTSMPFMGGNAFAGYKQHILYKNQKGEEKSTVLSNVSKINN